MTYSVNRHRGFLIDCICFVAYNILHEIYVENAISGLGLLE